MTEVIHEQEPRERRFKAKDQIEVDVIKRFQPFEREINHANMSIKCSMAEELRNMGLSEVAISRQLNIKAHYRGEK